MGKRLLLCFAVFLWGVAVRPAFVFGDITSSQDVQIQREVSQEEAGTVELGKTSVDLEELEKKKSTIGVKKKKKPPESQGPSFKVNEIILEGNTIFPTELLRMYVEPYEGRVLYLKDLQDLARLITAHYERAGYLTSRAYIPPQKIQSGTVIIRIVEGRVGDIKVIIKGNQWFPTPLYLSRINLQGDEIFNMTQLAMDLEDINDLPDRSVKAYLEPGEGTGTSDVVILAQDQRPLHVSYEYNNQGSGITYLTRNILHLTDNNLTGHGDMLQASITSTEQNAVLGGALQYVLPVPEKGLSYSLSTGDNYSRLEGDLRPLKVTSDSFYVSPGVTKTFIRAPSLKVDGFMGFDIKNSKTLLNKADLSSDRDRVLDIGPRVYMDDNYGKTIVSGDIRAGIPHFLGGASKYDPEASRIDTGGQFVYMTGSVDRVNRLPFDSYLVLHAGGQYSPEALTSLEQFSLGGLGSVRGYPSGDASGDSGFNFSGELRMPPYFIPRQWHVFNSTDKTWYDTLSLVTFLEGGRTFNRYRQDPSSAKDSSLLSAGFGLRYYISPDFICQAGLGFPFGEAPTQGNKKEQPYISARVGF